MQGKLEFITFLGKASLSLLGFCAMQALVYYVSGQCKLEFIMFLGKASLSLLGFCARQALVY